MVKDGMRVMISFAGCLFLLRAGGLTTGILRRTSFLKRGTLLMKSMTAPAPAPPQRAREGAHLKTAVGVLERGKDAGGG